MSKLKLTGYTFATNVIFVDSLTGLSNTLQNSSYLGCSCVDNVVGFDATDGGADTWLKLYLSASPDKMENAGDFGLKLFLMTKK